ncbi:DEAD/DEAH box helicase [Salinibacillus xinjiangensis]|uniref:DEAD/DEAH box helicase n=1 Tax=Salinibacillus xinjiangensis TaxID=1229268 RepID=A0A6G1X485_9BACI|nr:DEAD/DEAH box helicase [Salinibacillus xinjiangensis]MRG85801.1 DEAD/DEAH box helicase [Salinibacillus xinjiangensis]
MGFEEATPIQEKAIPVGLSGKDLIGQAQTGTGKTTAFGIPLVEKVDTTSGNIQGIILAPTRELAVQVAEELNRIGTKKGIFTLPIYGGQDIGRQIKALKKRPQIISATPGRLLDHMKRRTIRLDKIHTVVLDEADEMLNMGFIEEIEEILAAVTSEHHTMLFSATMPNKIEALAQRFMNNPEMIRTKTKEMTVKNIDQQYIDVPEKQKFDVLSRLLDIQSPELAIVFGRTKKRVDELTEGLKKRGYSAEGIHGDLSQSKRDHVIRLFKEQTIDIMVATDVAARGLDISGVTHVYNFDIPQDPESYVHRIGRTGRAGKKGLSVTLVTPREMGHLRIIEKVTKTRIERQSIPTYSDVIEGNKQSAIDQLRQTAENDNISEFKSMAENLLDDIDSVTLVSAAIKLLTKEPDRTPVQLTSVAPLRSKKPKNDGNRRRSNDRKYKDRKYKDRKPRDRRDRRNKDQRNKRNWGGKGKRD